MNDEDDNSLASGECPLEWVDDILQDEFDVDCWLNGGHSTDKPDEHQQPGRGNLAWNFVPASNLRIQHLRSMKPGLKVGQGLRKRSNL